MLGHGNKISLQAPKLVEALNGTVVTNVSCGVKSTEVLSSFAILFNIRFLQAFHSAAIACRREELIDIETGWPANQGNDIISHIISILFLLLFLIK